MIPISNGCLQKRSELCERHVVKGEVRTQQLLTSADRFQDMCMGIRCARKVTFKDVLMFQVCLMFFALQLDRGNISQALSDNMLKDLGVSRPSDRARRRTLLINVAAQHE